MRLLNLQEPPEQLIQLVLRRTVRWLPGWILHDDVIRRQPQLEGLDLLAQLEGSRPGQE